MSDSISVPEGQRAPELLNKIVVRSEAEKALGIPPDAAPIYDGRCRLLNWKHSAHDGMTVDLRLMFPGALGAHAFRGIPTGEERGQRFFLIVTLPRQVDGDDQPVVHAGETLLMRWSENDRTGMMARFKIDDGPDGIRGRHPFFGLSIGPTKGEPLDMAAWGIAEDESSLAPSKLKSKTPFHQLTEVQQSQILCRKPEFVAFLKVNLERIVADAEVRAAISALEDSPEQFANAAVRAALGVASRSIMNRDGTPAMMARAKWRSLLDQYEDEIWGRR